jgi:hypothetical protein
MGFALRAGFLVSSTSSNQSLLKEVTKDFHIFRERERERGVGVYNCDERKREWIECEFIDRRYVEKGKI